MTVVTQRYPKAATVFKPTALNMGSWLNGRPEGITVHHAADRNLEHVQDYGVKERVGYHLIIDRNGVVHQTSYLGSRVNHAGASVWRGRSPNRSHIAVCLLSWGRLKKVGDTFQSWSTAEVPNDSVVRRSDNIKKKLAWWDGASEAQERSLFEVLTWLCLEFKISPDDVCGHDEAAIPLGRKDDPGGVLSMKMSELRSRLTSQLK